MAFIKDGKADFIQFHCDEYRDHFDRILQWRERLGSTPNTAWASGNLGWRSVGEKLLRKISGIR